jgi:hypothetical protein
MACTSRAYSVQSSMTATRRWNAESSCRRDTRANQRGAACIGQERARNEMARSAVASSPNARGRTAQSLLIRSCWSLFSWALCRACAPASSPARARTSPETKTTRPTLRATSILYQAFPVAVVGVVQFDTTSSLQAEQVRKMTASLHDGNQRFI